MTVSSPEASNAPQRMRRRRRAGWAGLTAVALLLASACAGDQTDSAAPDGTSGSDAASPGATAAAGAGGEVDDTTAAPTQPPVDVAAALSRFQPPGPSSGLPPADPAHCPGADPEPLLDVIPDATAFQAASTIPDRRDAADDEVLVQCRMSYEAVLLEDDCTLMEVRDIAFDPSLEGTQASHAGALTTTSVMTYFTGRAQRPGIALEYTLSVGCDETRDLSDLEAEFRSIWIQHRDRFIESPPYERP